MAQQTTCILDTCVLIDLDAGRLLSHLRCLPYRFLVTDMLLADGLITLSIEDLDAAKVEILPSGPDVVSTVLMLCTLHRKTSVPDLFALILTENTGSVLLTNDGPLRKLATRRGTRTHGILWLLDEMVRCQVILPEEATQSLKRMLEAGSRLPSGACEQRLRNWACLAKEMAPPDDS